MNWKTYLKKKGARVGAIVVAVVLVLALIAGAERDSTHPLAMAAVSEAQARGLAAADAALGALRLFAAVGALLIAIEGLVGGMIRRHLAEEDKA